MVIVEHFFAYLRIIAINGGIYSYLVDMIILNSIIVMIVTMAMNAESAMRVNN